MDTIAEFVLVTLIYDYKIFVAEFSWTVLFLVPQRLQFKQLCKFHVNTANKHSYANVQSALFFLFYFRHRFLKTTITRENSRLYLPRLLKLEN